MWSVLLLGTMVFMGGCSATPAAAETTRRIDIDGAGVLLSVARRPALTPAELMAQVDRLRAEGRTASARQLIQRFPDVALAVMHEGLRDPIDLNTLSLAADAYDSLAAGTRAWRDRLAAGHQRSQAVAGYEQLRRTTMAMLQLGRIADAAKTPLPDRARATGSNLLTVDAWQLRGAAMLLAGDTNGAERALNEAVKHAHGHLPHHLAYLHLLRFHLAHQRDPGRSSGAWRDAAVAAALITEADAPIDDPVLWTTIAEWTPAGTSLPNPPTRRWRAVHPAMEDAGEHEQTRLWAYIGSLHMKRGEPEPGLMAFRRAQTTATTDVGRAWLSLYQGQALSGRATSGAARSILGPLAENPTPGIAPRAMSSMGVLELRFGDPGQAITWLRRAAASATTDPHLLADIHSDLALALLTVGRADEGLPLLHDAQRLFREQERPHALLQSLDNERRYHTATNNETEARRATISLLDTERTTP